MVVSEDYETVIKVVGVGGAGGNAIDRMVEDGLQGVEFIAINTDAKDLALTKAEVKLDVDSEHHKGQGAGGDPSVGRQAVEEHREDIKLALEGSDLVFITAGEGGGTGTGGAPVVAQVARELGALTVAVVTRPFNYEGHKKHQIADQGIDDLRKEVDALIVIPNQKLLDIADDKMPLLEAFYEADRALRQGVQGITDIILSPGVITTDFADAKTILKNSGTALMGIGRAAGPDRVKQATEQAITSPLNEVVIDGSTGALVKVTAPRDFPLREMDGINSIISSKLDPDAIFISGLSFDDDLSDEVVVTVIASGVKNQIPVIDSPVIAPVSTPQVALETVSQLTEAFPSKPMEVHAPALFEETQTEIVLPDNSDDGLTGSVELPAWLQEHE
ncbi:MAG: cell division protein FtsZ [Bifidobacteriaceae bacterium]|jgi:cell division protein FtsZ|nr:cell division protein FtsZ [Bifidobacteriaceae bacterium]